MITFWFTLLLCPLSDSTKIWIPNTDIDNKLNWDKQDTPKDCDDIRFLPQAEVAAYWNLKRVVITGLALPETGDVIFPRGVNIRFRDKDKCPRSRDLVFVRNEIKGWLDPDNWKSDSEGQWLPHSERVPCAGESILFPPERTFAVQLPDILIPTGDITFDNEVFRGDSWSDFLRTELGFQLFRGPDSVRSMPWRNDVGCSSGKKCICGRSSYSIRDGYLHYLFWNSHDDSASQPFTIQLYREANPHIFEEAVCLYAMPKCQVSTCYSPVVPEGHCCGICGAVIKIEDNTKDGLNISSLKEKVEAELEEFDSEKKLKIYVGRTKDENVQIVVVAEDSEDTIKSHSFANLIRRKLTAQKLQGRISSRVSGLRFSNYLFNSVSGAVFGTFLAVLLLFASLFYIYLILPKKTGFLTTNAGSPFMFARFENIVNEENLEIGVETETQEEVPQAFDNPMYSGSSDSEKKTKKSTATDPLPKESEFVSQVAETSKEYSNPIYSELEETKKDSQLLKDTEDGSEEFSEIKFYRKGSLKRNNSGIMFSNKYDEEVILPSPSSSSANDRNIGPQSMSKQNMPKYAQLLSVIEDMGKEVRTAYAGNKTSVERLKKGIIQAKHLVGECLVETERSARQ